MSTLKLEEISYQYKNGDRRVVNKVSCLFGSNCVKCQDLTTGLHNV
jgi:hypothetical protein